MIKGGLMINQSTLIRLVTHKYILAIIPIVIFCGIMVNDMLPVPMSMDEYVFYRITSQLPATASTTDWLYEDNPKTLYDIETYWPKIIDVEEVLDEYNAPIYRHTPLVNYLVYPIVRGVNFLADKGVIPHIEDTDAASPSEPMTVILRTIPLALFATTIWLIFKLLYHKVRRYAYLFPAAMIPGAILLGRLTFFYWDAFMWFFFFLTLFLLETRPNSKWAYVTACCMVNTKAVIGLVLLIPLIIKKRRMILAGLSIIPFYITTIIITHDLLYPVTHILGISSVYNRAYKYFWMPVMIQSYGLIYYGVMTLPIFIYVRKYLVYVATYIVIIAYAWGIGIAPGKIASMLYAGALVFPLIVHEFGFFGWANEANKSANEKLVSYDRQIEERQ